MFCLVMEGPVDEAGLVRKLRRGNSYTTLCPAPLAQNASFLYAGQQIPDGAQMFCCLLLDTYLDDSVPVQSVFKELPAGADDIRWLYHQRLDGTRDAHPYGIGFNVIKSSDRKKVTVRHDKVKNWGVDGGRDMDADRVAPNEDKDYTWEF